LDDPLRRWLSFDLGGREDVVRTTFGEELGPRGEVEEANALEIEAEHSGVLADLIRRLLDGDEERAFPTERARGQEVEPQHRLARSGPTADEIRATRQEAAVEHLIQPSDAGREASLFVSRRDLIVRVARFDASFIVHEMDPSFGAKGELDSDLRLVQ